MSVIPVIVDYDCEVTDFDGDKELSVPKYIWIIQYSHKQI